MNEADGLVSSDGNKYILQVEVWATTDEQVVALAAFIQATPEDRANLLQLALTARQIVEALSMMSMVVLPDQSLLQFDQSLTLRHLVEGEYDAPDSQ